VPKSEYKYPVMHVGIGKAYAEEYNSLLELADSLDCSPASLVWHAVKTMISNPPASAPAGAGARTGSAAGFWVLPKTDVNGRATGVSVIEVAARSDIKGGQTFFRYDRPGDDDEGEAEKSRGRAQRQAEKAGQHLCQLLGIDSDSVVAEVLTTA